jgi:hypothetical protein
MRLSRSALCVAALPAVGDAAASQIVRGQFDVDVIARRYPDPKPAQAPRETGKDGVTVLQLDFERRAGERLDDAADEAKRIFFNDGCEGLAAFLAAAPPSARWGNGDSFAAVGELASLEDVPAWSIRFKRRGQPFSFSCCCRVAMITGAIVIGMVGVAAGFTWDYLIKRDR